MCPRYSCQKIFLILITGLLFFTGSATNSLSQGDDDTRGMKPRDYAQKLNKQITSHRPPSKHAPQGKASVMSSFISISANDDSKLITGGLDVGLTLFQLREARRADDPVVVEDMRIMKRTKGAASKVVHMVPGRVSSETLFSEGDQLRLGIELTDRAYIYILSREQYDDGSFSAPYLVFPSSLDLSSSAQGEPGRLVYVPNEEDSFTVTRLGSNNRRKKAEVLTVILSSHLLEELPPLEENEEMRQLDPRQLADWERAWSGPMWKFENQGSAGIAMTRAEKKAGSKGRSTLSGDDPPPQTVYHLARNTDKPVIFTVALKIRQ